jgi:hypothetical protein
MAVKLSIAVGGCCIPISNVLASLRAPLSRPEHREVR